VQYKNQGFGSHFLCFRTRCFFSLKIPVI
jgi:hypothetical protein